VYVGIHLYLHLRSEHTYPNTYGNINTKADADAKGNAGS
jgi:hypothetical protein